MDGRDEGLPDGARSGCSGAMTGARTARSTNARSRTAPQRSTIEARRSAWVRTFPVERGPADLARVRMPQRPPSPCSFDVDGATGATGASSGAPLAGVRPPPSDTGQATRRPPVEPRAAVRARSSTTGWPTGNADGTRSPTGGRAGWPVRPEAHPVSIESRDRVEQRLGVRVRGRSARPPRPGRPRRSGRGTSPRCGRRRCGRPRGRG